MAPKYLSGLAVTLMLCCGCSLPNGNADVSINQQIGRNNVAPDDLNSLSDEFDSPNTLRSWRHVDQEEGWNANQLERLEIGKPQSGWMTMMPHTSTWYKDYRGVLVFKPVNGDFVVTTRLRVNSRKGEGPPHSQYSLAGIMIRTPRKITPQSWQPGGENYVFLSLGAADKPGQYQFEVKTTTNSDSQLILSPSDSGEAMIRVARIGASMILLKNTGGKWIVHKRYHRPDFPQTVQAGLTVYTDWPSASQMPPEKHNGTVIRTGNPDLVAGFDYVRFRHPNVPANLAKKQLDDSGSVSDEELLRFLGD